uniref:Erbb2 interacting protein n=1 Tax=Soboliphyme baturini TaxID=241478 RepID=A0A183ITS0_9BILA
LVLNCFFRTSSRQSGTNDESSTETSVREPLRYFGQKTVADRSANSPRTLPGRGGGGKMSLMEMRSRSLLQNKDDNGQPLNYASGVNSVYIPEPDYDSEETNSTGKETKESENSISPGGEPNRRIGHACPQDEVYHRGDRDGARMYSARNMSTNYSLPYATSCPQLKGFSRQARFPYASTLSSQTQDTPEYSSDLYRNSGSHSKQLFYISQPKNVKSPDSRNAATATMSRL